MAKPARVELERDPVLHGIVERLVGAYQPERIYLFGSKARGEEGVDSDYDLMIVVSNLAPPERCRSRLAYQALRGTGVRSVSHVHAGRVEGDHRPGSRPSRD